MSDPLGSTKATHAIVHAAAKARKGPIERQAVRDAIRETVASYGFDGEALTTLADAALYMVWDRLSLEDAKSKAGHNHRARMQQPGPWNRRRHKPRKEPAPP
jgi:hypothetical protein